MKSTSAVRRITMFGIAVLAMADQSQADTLRYRMGGDWGAVSDGSTNGWGLNPADPGIRVPIAGDEARVNWAGNTVSLDYAAPTFDRLLIGVDESGIVEVASGGVLTASEEVVAGNNGFIDGTLIVEDGGVVHVGRILWAARGPVVGDTRGFININSGAVMNVASHLWWGTTGTAEINISGTLNQTGGILGLGTSNAVSAAGGTATVNVLDGGLLALNNIHAGGTQSSIQPGSKIDISGSGQVTLPGDFVAVLEGYRDANLLYGNGAAGNVDIAVIPVLDGPGDFDADGDVDGNDFLEWQRDTDVGDLADWKSNYGTATAEQTVVTAAASLSAITSVPEPGSLTLILASSFAWCSFRRRRDGW